VLQYRKYVSVSGWSAVELGVDSWAVFLFFFVFLFCFVFFCFVFFDVVVVVCRSIRDESLIRRG